LIDSAVGKGAFGRLFQLWFQLPVEVDLANPRGVVRFFARLRQERFGFPRYWGLSLGEINC